MLFNNYVVLKKDEPFTGYLLLSGPVISDKKIEEINFVFYTFKGDSSIVNVNLKTIDRRGQLYDDAIWIPVHDSSVYKLPENLQKMYRK